MGSTGSLSERSDGIAAMRVNARLGASKSGRGLLVGWSRNRPGRLMVGGGGLVTPRVRSGIAPPPAYGVGRQEVRNLS